MNAYELADELVGTAKFINNISSQYHAVREINNAATMLRQQADQIAELEKLSKKCIVKDCENHKHEGGFVGNLCKPCHKFITTGKGKYSQAYRNTHPVKQLSDEEIIAVWDKDCVVLDEDKLVIRFARAIIKEITE